MTTFTQLSLIAEPNQSIRTGPWGLRVYQSNNNCLIDVSLSGVEIMTGARVIPQMPIISSAYMGLDINFWLDTVRGEPVDYRQFGRTQYLFSYSPLNLMKELQAERRFYPADDWQAYA